MLASVRRTIKFLAVLLVVLGIILVVIILLNPYGNLNKMLFGEQIESVETENSLAASVPSSSVEETKNEQPQYSTPSSKDEYANQLLQGSSQNVNGTNFCEDCYGTGEADCDACYGTGIMQDGTSCIVCYGDGKIPCEH